ncbi:MAG: usg protein [Hyphomicrobiales bacterium]
MGQSDFARQLDGYSLTTAEIMYRIPDHRHLLQTYIWQNYDLAPRFPKLIAFLDFWAKNLDGPLHTVRIAHNRLIGPAELKLVGSEWRVH